MTPKQKHNSKQDKLANYISIAFTLFAIVVFAYFI